MQIFRSAIRSLALPRAAAVAVVVAVSTALVPLVGTSSSAQEAAVELGPLTFTDTQARQGRAVFGGLCAGCHGDTLGGLDAPALVGDLFAEWFEGPVSDLFDFIMTNMPLDAQGTLTPQRTAQLTAFILQRNDFVPGDIPLPDDLELLALMGFAQE